MLCEFHSGSCMGYVMFSLPSSPPLWCVFGWHVLIEVRALCVNLYCTPGCHAWNEAAFDVLYIKSWMFRVRPPQSAQLHISMKQYEKKIQLLCCRTLLPLLAAHWLTRHSGNCIVSTTTRKWKVDWKVEGLIEDVVGVKAEFCSLRGEAFMVLIPCSFVCCNPSPTSVLIMTQCCLCTFRECEGQIHREVAKRKVSQQILGQKNTGKNANNAQSALQVSWFPATSTTHAINLPFLLDWHKQERIRGLNKHSVEEKQCWKCHAKHFLVGLALTAPLTFTTLCHTTVQAGRETPWGIFYPQSYASESRVWSFDHSMNKRLLIFVFYIEFMINNLFLH